MSTILIQSRILNINTKSYSYKNCTQINVNIFSIRTCIRAQFLYEYNSYLVLFFHLFFHPRHN